MFAHSSVQILLLLATGCLLFDNVQSNERECGKTKLSSGRVWGGEEVERHSIPWQVAIFVRINNDWKPICGGTLISQYHVLTAAHCVESQNDCSSYSVGIGMHKADVSDGTRVNIQHISNHPNYTRFLCGSNKPDFDFSILHLASPVDFDKKAQPACLPDESLGGDFLAGKKLTVSGWGAPFPGVLHKATYPAITNEDCKKYNDDSEDCSYITSNTLCAGNPRNRTKSHGKGDSGGPLTYNNNGRETVVGVVSWSDKCDAPNGDWTSVCTGKLAAYARVTAQLQWIKNEMGLHYDTC